MIFKIRFLPYIIFLGPPTWSVIPSENIKKEELMGTLQDTVADLEKESQRLETIKDKTIQKGFSES